MREQILYIFHEVVFFLISAVFITAMMFSVYIDVNWMHNALHENSLSEVLQEVILALITGMFFVTSINRIEIRSGLILIGGFYACMLIRELDFLFDYIKHGCWVWFALFTSAVCIVLALRSPQSIMRGLAKFISHRTWLMSATGLLIVLVFSRLFGMHQLWQNLMLDGYNRVVKNMAEESSELLGYSFCFLASARYLWQTRSQENASLANEKAKASHVFS
ncbi:hypothetical protein [Pantoea sp. App145]|uniref:hypothetical protein n=1 Tax=Pantoea sp. App145 TaxID=3071567 RepID=UPI003A808753